MQRFLSWKSLRTERGRFQRRFPVRPPMVRQARTPALRLLMVARRAGALPRHQPAFLTRRRCLMN